MSHYLQGLILHPNGGWVVGISEPSAVALGLCNRSFSSQLSSTIMGFSQWPSSCRLSREIAGIIKGRLTIGFL